MSMIPYHPSMKASSSLYAMSAALLPTSLIFMYKDLTILLTWEILTIGAQTITFPVILDPAGLLTSSIVLFISANVMMFAKTYMMHDPFIKRFTHLVLLFILSMNMLIFFPSLITLLLGWDGLGLVSFILVIYYQNPKSLGAGMITALTNRIGDALLLLSIGWMINNSHWLIINIWSSKFDMLLIMSILLAAMTKSAQMPFSSWLPAAMAAPTPVSALVHSSTLVTAGVFLLIRFYPFLSTLKCFNTCLILTASLTMLMAGISAVTECDLKKIIALSTLSQLGVMMGALGLGYPSIALFHLLTHALFKALLFICAGSFIHFHDHSQDLRLTGNTSQQLPLTVACMLIANLSLCGSPFLAGFYSKDLILEISLYAPTNLVILSMMFLATSFTAIYSMRFMILTVWAPTNSNPAHFISNSDPNIYIPCLFLTTGAIMAGATINWLTTPLTQEAILPTPLKLLPLIVTILGAILGWNISSANMSAPALLMNYPLNHEASCMMWFLVPMSTQMPLYFTLPLAHEMQKSLDHGWLEILGGQGLFSSSNIASNTFLPLQKNSPNIFLYLSMLTIIPILLFLK